MFTVAFPERDSGYSRVNQNSEDFKPNFVSKNWDEDDSLRLEEGFRELEKSGVDGFTHFVFQGTLTGLSVEQSVPEGIKEAGFYHQVHITSPDKIESIKSSPGFRRYVLEDPNALVVVNPDGSFDREQEVKLKLAFRERVGVLLGGGPGRPDEPFYRGFNRALDEVIKTGAPLAGICLGHEILGNILGIRSRVPALGSGYYELGNQVERLTERGKSHFVFRDFGESINVIHVNEYHLNENVAALPYVEVLVENAAGRPSALSLSFDRTGQAVTWQAHPEFPMLKGENNEVSKNISYEYSQFVRWIAGQQLHRRYEITAQDYVNLAAPDRLARNLGIDFYGRLLRFFVSHRMSNQ